MKLKNAALEIKLWKIFMNVRNVCTIFVFRVDKIFANLQPVNVVVLTFDDLLVTFNTHPRNK